MSFCLSSLHTVRLFDDVLHPSLPLRCRSYSLDLHVDVCNLPFVVFLAVPILACGGDNSQVHLYVQSEGQVSSDQYSFRGILFVCSVPSL